MTNTTNAGVTSYNTYLANNNLHNNGNITAMAMADIPTNAAADTILQTIPAGRLAKRSNIVDPVTSEKDELGG